MSIRGFPLSRAFSDKKGPNRGATARADRHNLFELELAQKPTTLFRAGSLGFRRIAALFQDLGRLLSYLPTTFPTQGLKLGIQSVAIKGTQNYRLSSHGEGVKHTRFRIVHRLPTWTARSAEDQELRSISAPNIRNG